jgi:hypothetical protein
LKYAILCKVGNLYLERYHFSRIHDKEYREKRIEYDNYSQFLLIISKTETDTEDVDKNRNNQKNDLI